LANSSKRDEQATVHSRPPRPPDIYNRPWRHIVGVSMRRQLSTWCLLNVRSERYMNQPHPTLACELIDLERMRWLPKDLARVVAGVPEMQELVVDQTFIGASGASFFERLVPRRGFIRTDIGEDKPGGWDHGYLSPQTLVNELRTAMQGGPAEEPMVLELKCGGAELEADLVAGERVAEDGEQLSDLVVAIAIAIWRARKARPQIEQGQGRQPKVILGYQHAKRTPR
jgi:hypothetical protein